METIIVEIDGGVAAVTGSTIGCRVVIVDWDKVKSGATDPQLEVIVAEPTLQVSEKLRAIADKIRRIHEGNGEA